MRRDAVRCLRLTAAALLMVALLAPNAGAADVEVTVAKQALQRFFEACSPFAYKYEPLPGAGGVEITLSNPRLILIPGKPGKVLVELDYQGRSPLLGLEPFQGRTRPEVAFAFDKKRGGIRAWVSGFKINIGAEMDLPLDFLIDPFYVPLVPGGPLDLTTHKVMPDVTGFRHEVTPDGVRFMADYGFLRLPPQKPQKEK
jgi:hypothetical protein